MSISASNAQRAAVRAARSSPGFDLGVAAAAAGSELASVQATLDAGVRGRCDALAAQMVMLVEHRDGLISHRACPPSTRRKWLWLTRAGPGSSGWASRRAGHRNAPPHLLRRAASRDTVWEPQAAAGHPNCPTGLLEALTEHPASTVADAAASEPGVPGAAAGTVGPLTARQHPRRGDHQPGLPAAPCAAAGRRPGARPRSGRRRRLLSRLPGPDLDVRQCGILGLWPHRRNRDD